MDTLIVIFVMVIIIIVLIQSKKSKGTEDTDKKPSDEELTTKKENEIKWNQQFSNTGNFAEFMCCNELEKIPELKILKNIYLFKDENHSAEIDVVAISKKGIIVIESKDYSGWIFGSENQKTWTQTFQSGKKFHFYNPIYQNKKHIDELMRYLNLPKEYFSSAIVFGQKAELKKITNTSNNTLITTIHCLYISVKNALEQWKEVLTEIETEVIYEKLLVCCNVTEEKKAKHIENVNKSKL